MNLINDNKKRDAIENFFHKNLLKLSKRLHTEGKSFFPTTFDRNATTYYTVRSKKTLDPKSFEDPDCISFEDFERKLIDLWESQGQQELITTAPQLADLAKILYNVEDQNGEISEFIYVMF